ncbi:hypothetical protein V3851_18520 [Paenibacillus sp. M1]|uniref:Uncharacterized protein n=1 Tax=Paenibacillus haidiansis TaxID=1574488 RepID=A0ABU7VWR2_9BACL
MAEYKAYKRKAPPGSRGGRLPSVRLLRRVAAGMLPFYRTVAISAAFSGAWSRAVVKADLDWMRKLLCAVAPRLAHHGLGSNGIGYFITFSARNSDYSCGITIPPGSVQFHFSPKIHRLIARELVPYCRTVACRPGYSALLAQAIRRNDGKAAARLVRRVIRSSALKSVRIDDGGLVLSFKYPFSKYTYTYVLFRDY